MAIQPEEAADALQGIERAQRRSAAAYWNLEASPHLFLWGVIWMIGYGLSYARPQWSLMWPVLVVLGFFGSFWIGSRTHDKDRRARALGWRYGETILAVFLFVAAIFAILPPKTTLQAASFFPILIAFWYAVMGIWTHGARMALLGVALGALTMTGFFLLPQYFLLWMAGVGGGSLILGGFWMRGA